MPTNYQWNKSVYYRLLIPELINGNRAIYLDSDVIVNCDIKQLWGMDLEGNFIAALKAAELDGLPYFNSAVIIFDLENLRK